MLASKPDCVLLDGQLVDDSELDAPLRHLASLLSPRSLPCPPLLPLQATSLLVLPIQTGLIYWDLTGATAIIVGVLGKPSPGQAWTLTRTMAAV